MVPTETQAALLKMKESIEAPLWDRIASLERQRNELFDLNRKFILRIAELELILSADVKGQGKDH